MELTFDLIYASLKGENAALREAYTEQQALILQLVEALEYSSPHTDREYQWNQKDWIKRRADVIAAGRAWLEGKP